MPAASNTSDKSPDPLSLAFGRRVAELRARDPVITPQELAARAGISVAFLWRIESGRQNASLRTVARLATAFGITLHAMFEGVEMPPVRLENRPYVKADDDDADDSALTA